MKYGHVDRWWGKRDNRLSGQGDDDRARVTETGHDECWGQIEIG